MPLLSYFQAIFKQYKVLKGQLHGRAENFEGLKMTFRTKIYHVNQHQKYYKLCFDNFPLRPLFIFGRALDRGQVEF